MSTATSTKTSPETDVLRGGAIQLIADATIEGTSSGKASGPGGFSGTAYAGNPVPRWFGTLVVDVDGIEVPESGVRPVLFMHSGDEKWGGGRVGKTTSITKRSGALHIEAQFLKRNEVATKVRSDLEDGFPWELSIGIDPIETAEIEPGESRTVNGREVMGPARVLTRSRLREVSVVDQGADYQTEVAMLRRTDRVAVEDITPEWLRANRPSVVAALAAEEEPSPAGGPLPEGEGAKEGADTSTATNAEADAPDEDEDDAEAAKPVKDTESQNMSATTTTPATPPATPATPAATPPAASPPAAAPASLEELSALKGASPEFVLECLRNNRTIGDASAQLIEKLSARVAELETARTGDLAAQASGVDRVPGAAAAPPNASAGGTGKKEMKFTSVEAALAAYDGDEKLRAKWKTKCYGSESAARVAFSRTADAMIRQHTEFVEAV